jgi:hypothetical protein
MGSTTNREGMMETQTSGEIAAMVAEEKFAWPGGYELFAVTDDGAVLCFDCCKNEAENITDAFEGDGWFVTGVDSMANCDEPQSCDHCYRVVGA